MWGPVNRLGLTARAGLGGYPRRRKRAVGRDPDFEGCPNYLGARELVERVAADLGIEAEVRLVEVQTPADAQRLRFLGSPTIRLNGRDVEPDADKRRIRTRISHQRARNFGLVERAIPEATPGLGRLRDPTYRQDRKTHQTH